jgi:hypothetical protein
MSTISGKVHLEDDQEEFHRRGADVEALPRWAADNGLDQLAEINLNSV